MRIAIAAVLIGAYYIALNVAGWSVTLDEGGGLKVLWFAVVYLGVPTLIYLGVASFIDSKISARKQDELRAALKAQNFDVTHRCGHGTSGFLIDAGSKRVCFYRREGATLSKWLLGFGDVLGSSIVTDGQVVTTSTRQGGLTRALVGGVLFGGAGAVVGAATAATKSTQRNHVRSMTLEVVLDCPLHPVHRLTYAGVAGAKELEFYQTLMELMMLDADIPAASTASNIHDALRMVRLKAQRAEKQTANFAEPNSSRQKV